MYDRGPARKPGRLSWGSGATPVFFGPATGHEYVAITDDADPHMNLVVLRTDGSGDPVCVQPLFTNRAASGTENAPVAAGRSVFLTNTYGYDYPTLPDGAGPSVPSDAPFEGGLTRVDVKADGSGCTSRLASSRADRVSRTAGSPGLLHTVSGTIDREQALAVARATVKVTPADPRLARHVEPEPEETTE